MNTLILPNTEIKEVTSLETPAIIDNIYDTFCYDKVGVQVFPIDVLKRTHQEHNEHGKPLRGLYHYEMIEQVANLCENSGLKYEIEEIFPAQNKNRLQPGVVVLPHIEDKMNLKNAVEAHILRRVFTTIKIHDEETEETNTTIALAFHQDGLQAAMGANVKICHNQTILSPERTVSTYGKEKKNK